MRKNQIEKEIDINKKCVMCGNPVFKISSHGRIKVRTGNSKRIRTCSKDCARRYETLYRENIKPYSHQLTFIKTKLKLIIDDCNNKTKEGKLELK